MSRVALALALLPSLLLAATARAEPPRVDLADPRIAEVIARVLEHIGYEHDAAVASGGGRIEVDGGNDLVIVVEPLDRDARRIVAGRGPFALPDLLWWDEARAQRLARALPEGRVTLHNPVDAVAEFDLWHGRRWWRRVTVEAHADLVLRDLPAGIVRVRRVGGAVDGWIYVTPWPSRVLRNATHETFNVPTGRYRLHGWHPDGGERSVIVTAN